MTSAHSDPSPHPAPDPAPRPEGAGDAEPPPTLRVLARRHALPLALAVGGAIISTVVAAVVSAYLDIWSTQKPPPGAPRLSASAEVWWDLASDERAVVAPVSAPDRRGDPFVQGDAMDDMDALVAEGAVNAGVMRVRLILTNFTKVPASITGVRARISGERPVPAGPVYRCGGSQGASDISRIGLDLKRPEQAALEYGDEGQSIGRYPSARIQVAAQGDPAYFDIRISGGRAVYDFGLEVTYRQGDQEHRLIVDDGGNPLTLAPPLSEGVPAQRCDFGTHTWEDDQ